MKVLLFFKKIKSKVTTNINKSFRQCLILPRKRKKLKNHSFSIISSNCNGCVVCHDLGVRFNSPTVNLYMTAEDYLKFVSNLKEYLQADLVELKQEEFQYPVGLLNGEIKLYFQHYKTFDEAYMKWHDRCKRVNFDNIFFMMTDRDKCSDDLVFQFDNLPYKNKLIFTAKEYPNFKSAVYCSEFKDDGCVGIMSDFSGINGKRYYDKYFDFVRWLNDGQH